MKKSVVFGMSDAIFAADMKQFVVDKAREALDPVITSLAADAINVGKNTEVVFEVRFKSVNSGLSDNITFIAEGMVIGETK